MQREPHELISSIALDCGFQHLGRFSLSYRETYGESPRDTVAQGRVARQMEDSCTP
jgi:AraC-like DNA-binding protein